MLLDILNNLLFTCNAVLPIVLLICVGYFLKRIKLLPDSFWKMANKLCFRVCLPVLLCMNIYNVSNITDIGNYWKVILFGVIAILSVFIIGLLIAIFAIEDNKQKGVILQCVFRSNYAIIGISLAEQLAMGDNTVTAVASIISAISIPLFNILAIIALSLFVNEEGKRPSIKSVLIKICKNPLIIGVLSGIILLLIRSLIPTHVVTNKIIENINGIDTIVIKESVEKVFTIKNNIPFLYTTLNNIAKIASPLALIALGGDFTFSAISRLKKQIVIGTSLRLVIVPCTCLIIAYLLGFRNLEFPALIALFGTPVAVSSVPMSIEMGNDGELAGQLVVWTSIFSAITLFLIILVCASLNIFIV